MGEPVTHSFHLRLKTTHNFLHTLFILSSDLDSSTGEGGRENYIFSKLETILLRSSERKKEAERESVGELLRQCKVKGKSAIFYE